MTHQPVTIHPDVLAAQRLKLMFERNVDHLDLHSFPTRRSSDLCPARTLAKSSCFCASVLASWMKAISRAGTPRRSEEHTSELQSHVNLVCRLLLEKKKLMFIKPVSTK